MRGTLYSNKPGQLFSESRTMKTTKIREQFPRYVSGGATCCVLAAALLLVMASAHAQDWTLDPVLRVGYEYDDNAPLVANPGPSDEIQGYLIEGFATIGYATERTTFDLTPRIRSRNYDEDAFDSDDGFLDLDFRTQGLKSDFRIRAKYSQEGVRTAEREDADPEVTDPDEITGDDSGRIFATGDRNRFWILPRWDYDISERTAIGASASYTDVDYDGIIAGTYAPYTDARFDISLTRSFSPRTRGFLRVGTRRYERDTPQVGVPTKLDGIGASIGIERGVTETIRVRAEVGVTETEPAGGQSDTDYVYDINVVRVLETTTLLAQVKRSVNSDGGGRATLRDSFNLGMTKQFSDRVEGGLGVRAYATNNLSSDAGSVDERDYAQIRATLSYAFTQTFLVEGDYRYTYLDRSSVSENSKSNSIIIWFTWQPAAPMRRR